MGLGGKQKSLFTMRKVKSAGGMIKLQYIYKREDIERVKKQNITKTTVSCKIYFVLVLTSSMQPAH